MMRRRIWVNVPFTAAASLLASIGAQAQSTAPLPAASAPLTAYAIPAEVLSTAAELFRAGPELAKIWPGYWPPDQAFIFYVRGAGALLVSPTGARPESFQQAPDTDLPAELRGVAFHHRGDLPGVNAPFLINYPIGGGRTAVVVTYALGKPREAVRLAVHEQFHAFQRAAFKGGISQFIDPAAIRDRTAFATSADIERRVLAAAISSESDAEAKALLRQYLALRREREATVPAEVVSVERGFERLEGMARYADLHAAAAIYDGGQEGVRQALLKQLRDDLATSTSPFLQTWFRTRSYAVGASMGVFLSRFDPGWRGDVEGGLPLDQHLEKLVGGGGDLPALARQARARFGYAERRRELEPLIQQVSKDEIVSLEQFYALAPYQVVFAYTAEAKDVRLGLNSRVLAQLSPSQMALPSPEIVSVKLPETTLTVSKRPFLRDGSTKPHRFVALLTSAPEVVGFGRLPLGEHRLERIEVKAEGYALSVEAPVLVSVTPASLTVTMLGHELR